ncbi:Phosphate ABC transporter substrate-binding protein [Flavobacterium sp. 9AF]|uniref:phosphate ABC transporter substrate-binding protein n=1 Tax=Flavobacterium sp. 9AF TaxID=2653142 RepID=UPI0012F139F5|nr:phosphate ABC transporter substrate-binding protein [Flavobacterium sp. 9AF]VXB85379.1 Phosphate ABC transporter substrate-binding protein [Flavobacterium sp. 9AF]
MRKFKRFKKAFGKDKMGSISFPTKMSNVQLSRIKNGEDRGCSRCFPHGWETSNSTDKNNQRNWKKFRKTQWKIDDKKLEVLYINKKTKY